MLGIVPVVLKKLTYLEIGVNWDRSRDSMSHSPRSRRDCGYRLFSYQNKISSTFSSGEQAIAALNFNFCLSELTNAGNNMSKVQLLRK